MKVHVDLKSDALYLRLDDSQTTESEEVAPGVILDINDAGQVIGVEILNVKERAPGANLQEMRFEVA